MSTQECDIVATLTPRPGKIDRIIELLSNLTTSVQETEPGVFSFHLYKEFDSESDQEKLILVEKYTNKKAYDDHSDNPVFVAMHKSFKLEDLMEKGIEIRSVKPVTGFVRD